jgi:hypothetical protein
MSGRWETAIIEKKEGWNFRVYNIFLRLIAVRAYFDALSGKMSIVVDIFFY